MTGAWFEPRSTPLNHGEERTFAWQTLHQDIQQLRRAEALLAGEKLILEKVARRVPLAQVLDAMSLLIEDLLPGCRCAVLLVEDSGMKLRKAAGPNLPAGYEDCFGGEGLAPAADPCSLAASIKAPVLAADVPNDARWRGSAWHACMAGCGFASCWAVPIVPGAGEVSGVLAIHRGSVGEPTPYEQELLDRSARIAGIAIERAEADAALMARQDELRQALAHLQQAQRLSQTGSFTTDVEADDHVWSDELYRVLEFEPGSKVKFQSFRSLIHPDDLPGFDAGFRRALAEGTDFDQIFRIVTPKGIAKHLHAVSHFSRSAGGHRIVAGSIQDVTAARNAEAALRAGESELKRALAQLAEGQRLSATGSFTSDIQMDQHSWSAEFYRIFEIDPGMQPNVQAIRDRVHPDDLTLFDSEIRRGMAGCEADFTFRIVTSQGSLKHLRGVAHVMEHVAGRPIFMGTVQDVSGRKAAEDARDRARSELAHVARATALSTLTASIAHEVNQPLAGIITNASTCLRMLAADPSDIEGAKATAQRTIRDAKRAADVVGRLRALFAGKPMGRESVDLNSAVREVLALTSIDLQNRRVVSQTELAADLPAIVGDRVQLQQVILNLVLNAAEAMSSIDSRARELFVSTALRDDGHVVLAVRDTGVGAAPEHLEQMFNAFYTTKPEGMGVGLSISRSIIEAHGGCLLASMNDGPGMTLSVFLPFGN